MTNQDFFEPNRVQAPPAYTHTASRTTTVIDIRVVSCNPKVPRTQQKTFTTQTTRSPSSPDMATCIGRCLSKSGIIEQGSNFPFSTCFRRCFFGDSVFRITVPSGWSGGREEGVLSGGAASPPLLCWVPPGLLLLQVVLLCPSLLLGGAAFLLLLHLMLLSTLRPQASVCFFIFLEPAPAKGGRGRQHDLKEEEGKQPHPQGRRGKTAPLKGRRKDQPLH